MFTFICADIARLVDSVIAGNDCLVTGQLRCVRLILQDVAGVVRCFSIWISSLNVAVVSIWHLYCLKSKAVNQLTTFAFIVLLFVLNTGSSGFASKTACVWLDMRAVYSGFPLTWEVQEFGPGILLVVREKQHVLSDCATVAVVLFQTRSVTSYFRLFELYFYDLIYF